MTAFAQTFTGQRVDFPDPKPEQINIQDISHALSLLCRFNGQINPFYSVADHSCNVADYLEKQGESRETVFAGLLHDAAEAYLGDIITPVKNLLPFITQMETNFQKIIRKVFRIRSEDVNEEAIKYVDQNICVWEARLLFTDRPVDKWDEQWESDDNPPEIVIISSSYGAKIRFMNLFLELKPSF